MDKTRKLFRVHTGFGDCYVVAGDYTEASDMVEKRLNDADYGPYDNRVVTKVELIAEESFFVGKQEFSGFRKEISPLMVCESMESPDYNKQAKSK